MKTEQTSAIKWNDACAIAKLALADDNQSEFYWLLVHSSEHFRPEVKVLYQFLVDNDLWSFFSTRETSYDLGLTSKIFKPLDLDN